MIRKYYGLSQNIEVIFIIQGVFLVLHNPLGDDSTH